MLTVTKDLMLPTTVTGSWPRPKWFELQLDGKALSTRIKDVTFGEQYTDALATLLRDQERAGLDILTTGDYHLDDMVGGHGWHQYPIQRWGGLSGDYHQTNKTLPDYEQGTILNEVLSAWRWPRLDGKLEANPEKPLEFAKIWRLAQSRASKPVMLGTVSSQVLPALLLIEKGSYYDGRKRDLIWDAAELMNKELHTLVDAGCQVIQIEDPMIHPVSWYDRGDTEQIDFLVDAFNREVQGIGNKAEIWIHTCWGNPNMQKGTVDHSYETSIETYLERMDADLISFEMTDAGGDELKFFKPFTDSMKKKVAIGVVSHRTLQVESAEEVAEMARRALEVIPAENLVLTSDCGFGRQGSNRMIALYKAAAIARGANIVRRELGLEERYVPIADVSREADGLFADPATAPAVYRGLARD